MTLNRKLISLLLVSILAFSLAGCSDDDDDMMNPTTNEASFTVTITNIAATFTHFGSGVYNTPVGAGGPGPLTPGNAYEVTFGATPGQSLSFAIMMVESNDLFFGPDGQGITLFDGMTPIEGDVTSQVMLWDAGTEENQEPGVGSNQPFRQSGANTGTADSDNTVRVVNDAFTYPAVDAMIAATLSYLGKGEFTLRLENASTATTLMPSTGGGLPVPLAPGVFVIHSAADPLFTVGMPFPNNGLEGLAEDGDPSGLGSALAVLTGLTSPLAPGAYAVHSSGMPIFTSGMADGGYGLEGLAEDGSAGTLGTWLATTTDVTGAGVFSTPVGAGGPGPLLPGNSYSFTFDAVDGDRLSFATMLVQSNDLFFGFGEAGLALFDNAGQAISGDMTSEVMLWDAGTEENQWPGAGTDQPLRQSGPNVGDADSDDTVRLINDGYLYPAVSAAVTLTITINN